jgi:hypothetical protein
VFAPQSRAALLSSCQCRSSNLTPEEVLLPINARLSSALWRESESAGANRQIIPNKHINQSLLRIDVG